MSATAVGAAWPAPRSNEWLVTVSVTTGTLMGTIDASIVNVVRGTHERRASPVHAE